MVDITAFMEENMVSLESQALLAMLQDGSKPHMIDFACLEDLDDVQKTVDVPDATSINPDPRSDVYPQIQVSWLFPNMIPVGGLKHAADNALAHALQSMPMPLSVDIASNTKGFDSAL